MMVMHETYVFELWIVLEALHWLRRGQGLSLLFRSFLLLPYTLLSNDHTNPLSFSPRDFNFWSNLIKYHIFHCISQLFFLKASLKFYLSLVYNLSSKSLSFCRITVPCWKDFINRLTLFNSSYIKIFKIHMLCFQH